MRLVLIGALGVSAMALSACAWSVDYDGFDAASAGHAPLKTVAALNCPASEGALTRTAQAADGQSCDYQAATGETVHLTLVALQGRSAADALASTRAELKALLPLSLRPPAPADPNAPGDHTRIDLPFFHVHTDGERAEVKMLGVNIHSEGKYADVQTTKGSTHTIVHAGPAGAEVLTEDMRGPNAALLYVLASEKDTPSGLRAVGYMAKGPAAGPLVVGEFRATQDTRHQDRHGQGDDLSRLIDRNVKD